MKRILFIFIAVLLSSSVVLSATELVGLTDFIDVEPGSWYEKAVQELHQKNIIKGYDDGTYKPAKDVNRAELAVVISKVLGFLSHPTGTELWQRYINDEFLFVVDYPARWKKVQITPNAIGFRPPWMEKNKVQWAVIVQDNAFNKLEELIAEMGAGYPETRAETRQQIELNGKIVTHVIVTTSEKPTWRHEQIFIEHFNKLYLVTNGAIENSDFELFWRSLKFLAPLPSEPPPPQPPQEPATEPPASNDTDYKITVGEVIYNIN